MLDPVVPDKTKSSEWLFTQLPSPDRYTNRGGHSNICEKQVKEKRYAWDTVYTVFTHYNQNYDMLKYLIIILSSDKK